jgi:pyruvate dehydrogenase (quinone)
LIPCSASRATASTASWKHCGKSATRSDSCRSRTKNENIAHLACRTALLHRSVSHITFPVDLQDREIKGERSKRNIPGHTSDVLSQSARLPHEGDLAHAADILNHGKRIVVLAGRGALGAGAELEQVAEMLGAPIVKALLGKAVVPDDSPYTTGVIGARHSEKLR